MSFRRTHKHKHSQQKLPRSKETERGNEKMVLKKSFRVLRRYKPRSVLLESKDIVDETLLFESNTIATLSASLPPSLPLSLSPLPPSLSLSLSG